jgi:peptidoglycan pentaglycine glycine transferase (the first glycine)
LKTYINKNEKDVEPFIKAHTKGHYMQAPQWAKVKSNWKSEVIIAEDDSGNIKGIISILIRKIPFLKNTMMYSPRGPVCDIHDKETFKALIDHAKLLAKEYKSYVLKLDPDITIDDEKFGQIVKDIGFKIKGTSKNFEGIQPRFVFRMDIKDKSEEELLLSFHQKTRYNINLAARKGVTVKIGSIEDIPEFHKIMMDTGIRDKFVVRSAQYFEKMYINMAPSHLRLYTAYFDGKMVAGTIAILYGNKCWYLYGASSNASRNVMPNYLLQWEMIKWAKESGCDIYDFRGISGDLTESNPLYGLYKFKKGFNGNLTEFVGELDFVFNPFVYFMVEKGEKVFRELRRKLFNLRNKKH